VTNRGVAKTLYDFRLDMVVAETRPAGCGCSLGIGARLVTRLASVISGREEACKMQERLCMLRLAAGKTAQAGGAAGPLNVAALRCRAGD
jgi:hypothetical protein